MQKIIKIIFLTCCIFIGQSCIESVQVPLRVESAKLVVEGEITNVAPPYTVRLSYTGIFHSTNYQPSYLAVSGAIVIIKDDQGNQTSLTQDLYDPFSYKTTDMNFVGIVGRTYSVSVTTPEGKVFVSKPEKLLAVPPIDKIYYEYAKIYGPSVNYIITSDGGLVPIPTGPDGFNIFIDTQDPANQTNFYRWTAYGYNLVQSTGASCPFRSSTNCYQYCWQATYSTEINILSDAQINGQTIKKRKVFFSPIYTIGQHLLEVSQYSISREAYQYYKLYDEQSKRTGSILDPLPAPIQGNVAAQDNVNELALGYFSAAGVSKKRYSINESFITDSFIKTRYQDFFLLKGDCRKVYDNGLDVLPTDW